MMKQQTIRRVPVHPGAVLRREMEERKISINQFARDTRMPLSAASKLVNEQRTVTAETALRLARYFGTSPDFWLNLQMQHDLGLAQQESGAKIEREVTEHAAVA